MPQIFHQMCQLFGRTNLKYHTEVAGTRIQDCEIININNIKITYNKYHLTLNKNDSSIVVNIFSVNPEPIHVDIDTNIN